MASLSYAMQDQIINILRSGNCKIGLLAGAPNADGTGVVEPNNLYGYARQTVSAWTATVRDSTTGRSTIKNSIPLVFGAVQTQAWPTLTYIGVFGSDGTLLISTPMAASRTAPIGDSLSFGAETIQLRFG